MVELKTCPACDRTLPTHSFYRNRARADGLSSYCRSCELTKQRSARGPRKRRPNALRDEHGKTCPRCGEHKPWSGYRKHGGARDGHQTYCAACAYLYEQESDARNAEAVKARQAEKLARRPDPTLRKTCRKCGAEKPLLEFYAHRATVDGRATYCRDCALEYGRAWNAANKEKIREYNRRRDADPVRKRKAAMSTRAWHLRKYGLTPERHDALLATQNGVCAICGKPGQVWAERNLHVDHDHGTNEVRGLLCGRCNVGLGYFQDDPALLSDAVEYLKNPPAQK